MSKDVGAGTEGGHNECDHGTLAAPEDSSAKVTSVPRPQYVTCPTCKEQARPAFRCGRCGTLIRIPGLAEPKPPKQSIVERTPNNPPYGELPEGY